MLAIPHPARQTGMSLIELLVGLAIVAISLSLAIPNFRAWIQNTQIRAAAESLQNGLQVARNEAIRRNANVEFRLSTGTNASWSVVTVLTGETVQTHSKGEGSTNVVLTPTPVDALIVTYTGLGRVAPNNDGTTVLTQLDVDVPTDVLPAAASRELRILIGAGGQIRMCDPTLTDSTDNRKCP